MASIAAMPGGEGVRRLAPFDRGDVRLERGARRVLRPRVLVALVLAELLLHVGRGLEDGRDDRAGAGIGRLSGVNADGREARARREFHALIIAHGASSPRRGPPPRRSPAARDLLFATWLGRLFLVAAALKFVIALLARIAAAIAARLPSSYASSAAPRRSALVDRGRHVRLAAVRPDQAAAAVARAPQADPLLHLHRRHPVAADPRLLPVRRQPRLHERQRLPVQGRLRDDRRGRAAERAGGRDRDRAQPGVGGGDDRARAPHPRARPTRRSRSPISRPDGQRENDRAVAAAAGARRGCPPG